MQLTDSALRVLSALLEARTGQRLSVGRQWRIEISLSPVLQRHGIEDCDALVNRLGSAQGSALADETVDAEQANHVSGVSGCMYPGKISHFAQKSE